MDAEISESDRRQWEAEFEAASKRPLAERFKYAFFKTYKPVLDDAPYRSFESMAEYRRWCEENLPSWLGYGRAVVAVDVRGDTGVADRHCP
jgi:hypothetical protein